MSIRLTILSSANIVIGAVIPYSSVTLNLLATIYNGIANSSSYVNSLLYSLVAFMVYSSYVSTEILQMATGCCAIAVY